MGQYISGPGLGLPLPQNLYPSELQNAPPDTSSNKNTLAPGDTLPIPAGDWFVNMGQYCVLQFLDPITNTWSMGPNAAWQGGHQFVVSDGFNVRVANLTSCVVGAVITTVGTGYVQGTTTIAATPGNSTWLPIVGGQLGFGTVVTANSGGGYGIAPEVFIPAPPPAQNNSNGVGGRQATGWVSISGGTVNGFTFTDPGAGYNSALTVALVPSPNDPNLATGVTAATLAFTLTKTDSITGVLCTNSGAALSDPNQITLTVTGAGSTATLTPVSLQTVITATVSTAGGGYGTVSALLTTVGGVPPAGGISSNADGLGLAWRPRPAQIGLTVTGVGTLSTQAGTIYDGGLFLTNAVPGVVLSTLPTTSGSLISVTQGVIALTMGGRKEAVTFQPAP